MNQLLRNDTALVTGAAQGIGQAIARAIEEEGAKVFAVDREFDLAVPGTAGKLAEKAIQTLGTVSIFVHAASPPRKEEQNALAAFSFLERDPHGAFAVEVTAATFLDDVSAT